MIKVDKKKKKDCIICILSSFSVGYGVFGIYYWFCDKYLISVSFWCFGKERGGGFIVVKIKK